MTAFDEFREQTAGQAPQRPSPLPWILLAVAIALTVGILWLGRSRLAAEKERTAAALKANDELNAKVKAMEAARARTADDTEETPAPTAAPSDPAAGEDAELKQRIVTLELQNRTLQQEIVRLKKKH
jgi:cytoskeletal protein RodZ